LFTELGYSQVWAQMTAAFEDRLGVVVVSPTGVGAVPGPPPDRSGAVARTGDCRTWMRRLTGQPVQVLSSTG
jgi:hypothetical protein